MQKKTDHPRNGLKESIRLEDGRRLGYKEYGVKDGFPILALHGTPGSRIWFALNDPTSIELGIRLITIDRPGYGLSDKKEHRKIIDFNADIDQLLNQLSISKFSIFGVSGGGAYSLAFASKNDPKVYKVGIVASAYEFINGKIPSAMCRPNRIGFYLAKHFPWLLKYSYNQQKKLLLEKPDIYQKSIQKHVNHLCKSDQEVLNNIATIQSMTLHIQEAFRGSPTEAVNELRMLGTNWGIEFSKIDSTVEIWHGEEDTLSPIVGLKKFIERIPNCRTNFLEGKGHFLDEDPEIWKNLLRSLLKG